MLTCYLLVRVKSAFVLIGLGSLVHMVIMQFSYLKLMLYIR